MLKIKICDDDDFTVRLIHGLLEKAIEISKTEARIVCKATSGSDVLNYIHKNAGPYLYFLDFDFGRKELNGIDLAKKIYQYDTNGKIIFVTSHGEMLMYGKEANNRKQEIDRQHHTIPNQRSQRPKDKYCGKIKTFGFFHNADYYGIPCIYLSDFALSSAKKSIPCLRNKYYNKAIDNRILEVANMSGCLRLRNI